MATDGQADATYRHFSTRAGNQHIASVYALERAVALVERFRIQRVLEVGLGIGSLAHALLTAYPHLQYTGTEANRFCLSQLPENLGAYWQRVRLYASLAEVPAESFGLIIVDGGDPALGRLPSLLEPHGIVFVEGYRLEQVEALRRLLGPRCLRVMDISHRRNPVGGPFPANVWSGGAQILYADPSVRQRLAYVERRVLNAVWYRLRGPLRRAREVARLQVRDPGA